MFGTKKLIQQYEARIQALEAHIKDLRTLVIPQNNPQSEAISLENDLIMNGSEHQVEVEYEETPITSEQRAEHERVISERDRLLSGTY